MFLLYEVYCIHVVDCTETVEDLYCSNMKAPFTKEEVRIKRAFLRFAYFSGEPKNRKFEKLTIMYKMFVQFESLWNIIAKL